MSTQLDMLLSLAMRPKATAQVAFKRDLTGNWAIDLRWSNSLDYDGLHLLIEGNDQVWCATASYGCHAIDLFDITGTPQFECSVAEVLTLLSSTLVEHASWWDEREAAMQAQALLDEAHEYRVSLDELRHANLKAVH